MSLLTADTATASGLANGCSACSFDVHIAPFTASGQVPRSSPIPLPPTVSVWFLAVGLSRERINDVKVGCPLRSACRDIHIATRLEATGVIYRDTRDFPGPHFGFRFFGE